MTDDDTRKKLRARLRRVEGQIAALGRMMDDDAYCVDVLTQISAAQGALGKVADILLGSHLRHCVADAFENGDEMDREQKIEEVVDVFSRYGKLGAR